MLKLMTRLWKEEQGQDLIEYTLLAAFVCLASAGLFITGGASISAIWLDANTDLSTATSMAS